MLHIWCLKICTWVIVLYVSIGGSMHFYFKFSCCPAPPSIHNKERFRICPITSSMTGPSAPMICMIDSTFIQTLSEHEQCWYSTRRPEGSSGDHSSHEGPKHYSDTFFPLICHTSVCPLCSDWTKTLTVLMFPSISVCPMLGCWPSVYCLTFKKNLPWKGNRGAEKTENRTTHCGFAFLMKMNLILCHSWQL